MGKQKQIFKIILDRFSELQNTNNLMKRDFLKTQIRVFYQKSLNKKDLTRRLLFDCILSDEDILKLLRIIFNQEKKTNERNNKKRL